MPEKKEQKVSIFDPVANAFREIPISLAIKFIESAKKLEKEIGKDKKQNE